MKEMSFRSLTYSAFSLVEVMIALAIFSFAFVSISGLLMVGLKNDQVFRNESSSTQIAIEALVTRRNFPRTDNPDWILPPIEKISKTVEKTEFVDALGNRVEEPQSQFLVSYRIQMTDEPYENSQVFIRVETSPRLKKKERPAELVALIPYEK